jgi:hypothetical protein
VASADWETVATRSLDDQQQRRAQIAFAHRIELPRQVGEE